ncbi:MAG: methylation-associated defense system AAA family ATPase MAD3 [Rectinemataceae bacterium]
MIEQIEIRNFKALKAVKIRLGEFQVLVGPNASGKSSFFDSISLVRDILSTGLEKAIFGDSRSNIQRRAENARELTWLGQGGLIEIAFTVGVPKEADTLGQGYTRLRYELAIDSETLGIESETLWLLQEGAERADFREARDCVLFPEEYLPSPARLMTKNAPKNWRKTVLKTDKGLDYFRSEKTNWNNQFKLGTGKAALGNLFEDPERFPVSLWFKNYLRDGVFRLMLNAEAMRSPAPASLPSTLFSDGSNIPWVVHALERGDPGKLKDWTAHLRTALPDLRSITTIERPENNSRYLQLTYSSGLAAPSWVLSDGTLRLLALTLLAYMDARPSTILVEEPENGIHPRAIETVMQSLNSVYGSQVFCASHSALVLGLVEKTANLLCFGKNRNGSADVIRGDDHPQLKTWQASLRMSDLYATGIL